MSRRTARAASRRGPRSMAPMPERIVGGAFTALTRAASALSLLGQAELIHAVTTARGDARGRIRRAVWTAMRDGGYCPETALPVDSGGLWDRFWTRFQATLEAPETATTDATRANPRADEPIDRAIGHRIRAWMGAHQLAMQPLTAREMGGAEPPRRMALRRSAPTTPCVFMSTGLATSHARTAGPIYFGRIPP